MCRNAGGCPRFILQSLTLHKRSVCRPAHVLQCLCLHILEHISYRKPQSYLRARKTKPQGPDEEDVIERLLEARLFLELPHPQSKTIKALVIGIGFWGMLYYNQEEYHY